MPTILHSFEYLSAQGWEWFTNTTQAEGDSTLKFLRRQPGSDEYCMGEPKGTAKYSSQQLKLQGMVGLYKRGGKHVKPRFDTPQFPVFSEPDVPPAERTRPGMAHDRPPKKVFAGSGTP